MPLYRWPSVHWTSLQITLAYFSATTQTTTSLVTSSQMDRKLPNPFNKVDGQDDMTFLQDANLTIPNNTNLGTLCASCLPVTVPLPYGHGIVLTPANDTVGLTNLSNRLNVLNPKLSLWCSSIHMTADIFKGKSLQHATLHVNNAYFKGLDQGAILRPTIFAHCQPLSSESPMAHNLFTTGEDTLARNFDSWCTANKEKYNELTSPFIHRPAPTTPLPPIDTH